ncbi:MAG TPA: ABC transporter permease [Jiangellaceae bacterium]
MQTQAARASGSPAGLTSRFARALPIPAGAGMARMLIERNIYAYRRYWVAITTGFFEPVFYLFAMGVGLGRLIGEVDAGGGRMVEYALFVAPALLAASAMGGAIFDSTINVFFRLRYQKLYDSVLATPLGPRDVAIGEIATALLRGLIYSIVFLGIATAAGFVQSWWALLAMPAASLVGFAFASVGMAVGTFMKSVRDLDYVQLAIMPMFLLSATFFPLSAYPEGVIQWVVQASPLYNSVALVRGLMLGDIGAGLLVHVAYLVVMGLIGVYFAALRVERLLLR